jgi:hypothetical protein
MGRQALCVFLTTFTFGHAAEAPPGGHPPPPFDPQQGYTQFLIPRAAKPPTLDGQVEPGEWDQAVALNVMADQTRQWKELYPRWVKWRLAWDAERAFAACGRRGFVLGPVVGFRCDWPWKNLDACDRAWRRLR